MTALRRLCAGDPGLEDVLELIRRSFAAMEGRIDPPSSMHRLTLAALQDQCRKGEIWVAGTPPAACVFLTPRPDCLYLGKLAVDEAQRGSGLARALVELAATRARALDLPVLRLQTRVELTENHAAFASMGFCKTGETAHPGFDRPTSVTMEKPLPPLPGGPACGSAAASSGRLETPLNTPSRLTAAPGRARTARVCSDCKNLSAGRAASPPDPAPALCWCQPARRFQSGRRASA